MPTHHMNDPARAAMPVSRPPTIDIGLGRDSLIDVDVGSTPEADDSGGLLGGVLRRIGI